jgi:hypothetical protein
MKRPKQQCDLKIKKIAPHTYYINGAGYRTMRDILAFNKAINKANDKNRFTPRCN